MAGASGEKTEQPTQKRLRDSRKKGQVAKSKEVASAAIIIGLFLYIWAGWGMILDHTREMILLPAQLYTMPFRDALSLLMDGILHKLIILILPIVMAAMFLAILSGFLQIGVLFALESVKPDLKKINPMEGIKKIFSIDSVVELIKSIVKVSFLSILIYKVIQASIDPLLKLPFLGLSGVMPMLGALMKNMAVYTIAAFGIVALADFFWQKHSFTKKNMMTKDEVKREYKEMEGDPVIKGKRKQLQKEMAMSSTVQKTRKASVVVTNPTRLAVALYYDEKDGKLPVVLAKGSDLLARRMVEAAREEGIPIMQNIPLAQALYEQVEMEQYIPSDLIEPVAEVLKWVEQVTADIRPD